MRGFVDVRRAEFFRIGRPVAPARRLVRLRRYDLLNKERVNQRLFRTDFPIGFDIRRDTESRRLLQQKLANNQRGGGFGPGPLLGWRRMVLHFGGDSLRRDLGAVYDDGLHHRSLAAEAPPRRRTTW